MVSLLARAVQPLMERAHDRPASTPTEAAPMPPGAASTVSGNGALYRMPSKVHAAPIAPGHNGAPSTVPSVDKASGGAAATTLLSAQHADPVLRSYGTGQAQSLRAAARAAGAAVEHDDEEQHGGQHAVHADGRHSSTKPTTAKAEEP